MTQPMPTPSTDSAPLIDAGIRRALLSSPALVEAIRGMLRHAIVGQVFEHGRALKTGRLTELLNGLQPQDVYDDEWQLVNALKAFVQSHGAAAPIDDKIRQAVHEEVTRQLSDLKITRSTL